MNRSYVQTRTGQWKRMTFGITALSIVLIALGSVANLSTAAEAEINVELIALTGSDEYAVLASGTDEAVYAVAMRIQAGPEQLNMDQLGKDVEANLTERFTSFTELHAPSETVFTAFFTEQEELGDITEAILPAFEQQTETSVSVRTDPEPGRRVFSAE